MPSIAWDLIVEDALEMANRERARRLLENMQQLWVDFHQGRYAVEPWQLHWEIREAPAAQAEEAPAAQAEEAPAEEAPAAQAEDAPTEQAPTEQVISSTPMDAV